jgi:hypothetical protein
MEDSRIIARMEPQTMPTIAPVNVNLEGYHHAFAKHFKIGGIQYVVDMRCVLLCHGRRWV